MLVEICSKNSAEISDSYIFASQGLQQNAYMTYAYVIYYTLFMHLFPCANFSTHLWYSEQYAVDIEYCLYLFLMHNKCNA